MCSLFEFRVSSPNLKVWLLTAALPPLMRAAAQREAGNSHDWMCGRTRLETIPSRPGGDAWAQDL